MNKSVVKYTVLEKIADCIVVIGLLSLWIIVYLFNQTHTGPVPTHFNIRAEADAFGSTQDLYLLMGLNTLLIALVYFLKWKQVPLNFGTEVTPCNKSGLRSVMNQTLSLFAISLLIIFAIIVTETVFYKEGKQAYSFIIIFFAVKVPVVFYMAKIQGVK